MVVCAAVVGRKLHWTRSGDDFLLKDGDKLLCTMSMRSMQIDCVSEGCCLSIRRKGLLRPRLEMSDDDRSIASIANLEDFEPEVRFNDGTVYTLRYLNEARTALAFFDEKSMNVMELTDASTWSEPRSELVANRDLKGRLATTLMTVGHYMLMQQRGVPL